VKRLSERLIQKVKSLNVSQQNDTDVANCNFNSDQPILIIFDRDLAETVCYQTMIW